MYYYYYNNTYGYSAPTLALRAKSSFCQSLNGGDSSSYYSQSSLYSIPRNPSFLLYSYLLSRRHHSAFVRLEPSTTFLLTGGSRRRSVGVCDRRSSSRCCCCCGGGGGCSKGDHLGSAFKKPPVKEGFCNAGTRSLRKNLEFSSDLQSCGVGRRRRVAGEPCGCNKGDDLWFGLEMSSRKEELCGEKSSFLNDYEGAEVGRRRNVVVGESSRGGRRSWQESDGLDLEDKEVREVRKYEDDACFGRDTRKGTERKGLDRRVNGREEVDRPSNRYSKFQNESNVRKENREDDMSSLSKQKRGVDRSERAESSKSSQLGNNVERLSNSQRRFEQVRANGREDRSSTVDSSVKVTSDNRTEIDRQGFSKMESDRQYETQTDFSRIHASDTQRATGRRSSLEIRDDNMRSDNNQRYFEVEKMKREKKYSSVENVVQVARDDRTELDQQELDKMKSKHQYETQTNFSRAHATDTQRASSSRNSLELRAEYRSSDNSQRYFEEEQLKGRKNRYASVENVAQVARDNRTEVDRQEFDKMKSNRQYETQTDISRVHATDTRRANDTNSSLDIRADSRWSDIRQSYFTEEEIKERENRSTFENIVQEAREKRTQMDQQEFDKMESNRQYETHPSSSRMDSSETKRASSSSGSLGMRTDVREENLGSAIDVAHGRGQRWIIGSERVTNVHELERRHTERLSNLQEISDTIIENRKEASSSLLVQDREKQRSTVRGESSHSTTTQMSVSQSLDGSSSSLYQLKNDAVESASRLGNSSASYVGEFVDKLRQEISTTELSETNSGVHRGTIQSGSDVTARLEEGRYTEEVSRDSSSRSRIKGPSDEMWELRGVSSQEPSKIEEPEKDSSPVEAVDFTLAPGSAESAVSRRSHRSLWTYLASIIKLGWGQSGRSHNSGTKSSARSSSNESIGSEAWFSGNEADENEDETEKKERNSSPKESTLTETPAEQYEIGSSTSTGTLRICSSSKRASLVSGAEDSEWHEGEEGQQCLTSGVVHTGQAPVLTDAEASPSMTEIGKRTEEFSREILPVVSGTEGSETELRGRVRSPKEIGSTKDPVDQSQLSSSSSMGIMRTSSSSKGGSLVSRPEDLEWSEGRKGRQGTISDVATVEQLPSFTAGTGSPFTTEVETVQMPESGSARLEDKSNRGEIPEVGGTEGKDGELNRRKFQRNKQVMKEQFDEWEEAYVREREQRQTDELFMREALLEAKKAADAWEVPVGAILVQNGKVIARGCNLVEELRDSTAHAEMICIREASSLLRSWRLAETTLYVTLEPCAMCAGAILQARIDTVVWGAPNKLLGADGSWVRLFPSANGGSTTLDSSNQIAGPVHPFHPKITIRRGILATECADAMQQFFQLRRKKIKKEERSPPPSCLPVSTIPTKFFTKMQDIFHIMFCL
ncbi:putative tRNA(adenine(34)) deaminase, chloroplastic isoform X1 [Iris pallida]|uniref:tRNA(adenine(34)) deaminase n=1 Tax=Iris pallida TaxID=29817 RepID=A0AAX6DUY9_IRIPA|nr:putative tRNA(adenine(34)) deaminase, chloroplastic isoform X1 [Iris pallida]